MAMHVGIFLFTCAWNVPEHYECKMDVKVICNVEGKDKNPTAVVLGTQTLEYATQTESLECANQLYLGTIILYS